MLGTFPGCSQYLQVLHTGPDECVNLNIGLGPGNTFLESILFLWAAIYTKKINK